MKYTNKKDVCSLPDKYYDIIRRFDKVYSIHGVNYEDNSPLVIECTNNKHWRHRNQLLRIFEEAFLPIDTKRELVYLIISWEDDGTIFVNSLPTNWKNHSKIKKVYFKEKKLLIDIEDNFNFQTLSYEKDIYKKGID